MKVSIVCATSLDGYLNPKLEMSPEWTSVEDKKLFAIQTKQAGVIVMGDNTFKYSFDNQPLAGRWNVVVTHHTDREVENVWFTDGEPKEILKQIEEKGHSEVMIIGGSIINSLFMNAGLVTDLYITVTSHIFGGGIPLFGKLDKAFDLELLDTRPLGPGEILNHYKVI